MTILGLLAIIALLVAVLYAVFAWGHECGSRESNCEDCARWMERMQKPAKPEEFK
jgi:hypothetical protein